MELRLPTLPHDASIGILPCGAPIGVERRRTPVGYGRVAPATTA